MPKVEPAFWAESLQAVATPPALPGQTMSGAGLLNALTQGIHSDFVAPEAHRLQCAVRFLRPTIRHFSALQRIRYYLAT